MRGAWWLLGAPLLALLGASEPPARVREPPPCAVDTPLGRADRADREASWTRGLPPLAIVGASPGSATTTLLLYAADGSVDPAAQSIFERAVAPPRDPHPLATRLLQLVYKAATHFGKPAPDGTRPAALVVVVSAWRAHAGRHSSGDALDFKLAGVRPATLAAWLRGVPRVGVGIYTHPRTQYVHLDVRELSYHWVDGSPPGVSWKERQIRDPGQIKRDASWTPESDLPL